jgi:tellurite resistance protein
MHHEMAASARRERNAALMDAMILGATADGHVSKLEKDALLRRVGERPEFEGTKIEELKDLIENSIFRLSKTSKLEDVLASLRTRLPDHKNRLLAFGLATAVALADQIASKQEMGLLKTLQKGLGISEEEVARIVEVVEEGKSLSEALGEPAENLYAEVMVLASVADGVLEAAEADAVVELLAGDPIFAHVNAADARRIVRDSLLRLKDQGLPARLAVLARGLTTHKQRIKAFTLAARVVDASEHEPSKQTSKMLDLLQATFGIADDEVAKAHSES